jgi:hypothetical protein
MANRAWMLPSLSCAAVLTATLAAQSTTPAPPQGIPPGRGVFFQAPSGWVSLPGTDFVPFSDFAGAGEFLGFDYQRYATAQLLGPHAEIQSGTRRPVFYLRGYSPADPLYLVRSEQRPDYRAMRMRISSDFWGGPHFLPKNLVAVNVGPAGEDLIRVEPRVSLEPGEYALVTNVGRGFNWIYFAYGFGVPATASNP